MPVAAYALDTLANVKSYLGVGHTDHDTALEGRIAQYSEEILRETGREFAPKTPSSDSDPPVTRLVEYRPGSGFIRLAPYEARLVTAITLNVGADDQKVLVAGDWMLEPITNPDGVWDTIVLKHNATYGGSGYGVWDRVPAAVTGRWGWPVVPEAIKGFLHRLIEDDYRQNIAAYADADGTVETTSPVTVGYAVRQEMAPWMRVRIGAA